MATIPGIESINYWGIFIETAKWIFYIVGGLMVAGISWAAIHLFSFPIKCRYWEVYGSGKDGILSVTGSKTNRFKWNKEKSSWKPLKPFFNKIEVEPFDSEYIYPGKQVYAFKFNETYHPGRIDIVQDEDTFRGVVRAVPHSVRAWQSLQHKKNAQEYASGILERHRAFVMTIITVLILCILVGFTFWLIFQFTAPTKTSMDAMTTAINRMADATIPSK